MTHLYVEVKRFRCLNQACSKSTFVERLDCLPLKAQRTQRLSSALQAVAFGLGGEAGCRLATQLQIPASADTLLRLIRNWSAPKPPAARVVGVDDWALRKRVTYGTIVVDLETHQPIELLEERTSAVLKSWLLEQEGIEVIARDRSGDYALGAKEGAPEAIQVADRFHLLQNMKQMLDRFLINSYKQLKPLLTAQALDIDPLALQDISVASPTTLGLSSSIRDTSKHEREVSEREVSNASRERRLELYEQVKQLQAAGWKIEQISRRLDLNHTTVRKFFYAKAFPEPTRRTAKGSMLNPFLTYLESRFEEGCRNAMQLWREIKEKGYPGTWRQVLRWMRKRRLQEQSSIEANAGGVKRQTTTPQTPPASAHKMPSPRQLAWLMMRQPEELEQQERNWLSLIEQHTQVKQLYSMARKFNSIVRKGEAAGLDQWLEDCKASQISMLQTFAVSIKQDYAAVRAALETKWSNGQTEGHINRLKLLKRQMYGRANFDLLRQRVLYAA
jgi:transposase